MESVPGETQFEERATAATTARRRNSVDACYSCQSPCIERHERDNRPARTSVFVSQAFKPEPAKYLAAETREIASARGSCARKIDVSTLRQYSPQFPVKPCNFYGIAVRAVRAFASKRATGRAADSAGHALSKRRPLRGHRARNPAREKSRREVGSRSTRENARTTRAAAVSATRASLQRADAAGPRATPRRTRGKSAAAVFPGLTRNRRAG